MSEPLYDYVVVGLGGIGSATVFWLSRIAPNVFSVLSNSSWDTRKVAVRTIHELCSLRMQMLLRKSVGYTDTPVYSSLAQEMYSAWRTLESDAGLKVLHVEGGCLAFVDMDRFFEPEAGLVDAGLANLAHQQRARAKGATLIESVKVTNITHNDRQQLLLHTSKGNFAVGKKLIVTSGAWVNQVLAPLKVNIPVKVTLENVTYLRSYEIKHFQKERFPCLIYKGAKCDVYTLPHHGVPCFKVGMDAAGEVTSGDGRHWTVDGDREQTCLDWVNKYVPEAIGPVHETKTCLYTMTNDRHFVVDDLGSAGHSNVLVCCGAGHAFKFAAVLGKTLSELAVHGKSEADISAFSVTRPAVADPNFAFWRDSRAHAKI